MRLDDPKTTSMGRWPRLVRLSVLGIAVTVDGNAITALHDGQIVAANGGAIAQVVE